MLYTHTRKASLPTADGIYDTYTILWPLVVRPVKTVYVYNGFVRVRLFVIDRTNETRDLPRVLDKKKGPLKSCYVLNNVLAIELNVCFILFIFSQYTYLVLRNFARVDAVVAFARVNRYRRLTNGLGKWCAMPESRGYSLTLWVQ